MIKESADSGSDAIDHGRLAFVARIPVPVESTAVILDDEGIDVQRVETGSILSLYTRNTHYRITVLNGAAGTVVVQGGAHFPEPTYARLQGARGLGSTVRIGWIGVGLRLEFVDGPRRVLTSAVQSIVVEELPPAQRSFWRVN